MNAALGWRLDAKSRARMVRASTPTRLEASLRRHLTAHAGRWASEARKLLRPALRRYARAYSSAKTQRADALPFGADPDDEIVAAWNAIQSSIGSVAALTAAGAGFTSPDRVMLERVGFGVVSFGKKRLREWVASDASDANKKRLALIDVDEIVPPGVVDAFVFETVDLIESIPASGLAHMEKHVGQALRAGTDPRVLARRIEKSFDVSKARAKLIARDQLAKANSAVTEHVQTRAGIMRYRWLSSRDGRVRHRHAEHDGKIFDWRDPGPIVDVKTGRRAHAGRDYQCRCVAVPVLDDAAEDRVGFSSSEHEASKRRVEEARERLREKRSSRRGDSRRRSWYRRAGPARAPSRASPRPGGGTPRGPRPSSRGRTR